MKHQYRMQGELVGITERFANGEQTLADALLICGKVIEGDSERIQAEWRQRFLDDASLARVLSTDNNSKAALNWELIKRMRGGNVYVRWDALDDQTLTKSPFEVTEQLEPKQCVWQYMPVICLENYANTSVMNGSLCWVIHVIKKEEEEMPRAVLVVAAPTRTRAEKIMSEGTLESLMAARVLVPIVPTKRQGRRALPLAPVWCSTIHKIQEATLDWAVLSSLDKSLQVSCTLLFQG